MPVQISASNFLRPRASPSFSNSTAGSPAAEEFLPPPPQPSQVLGPHQIVMKGHVGLTRTASEPYTYAALRRQMQQQQHFTSQVSRYPFASATGGGLQMGPQYSQQAQQAMVVAKSGSFGSSGDIALRQLEAELNTVFSATSSASSSPSSSSLLNKKLRSFSRSSLCDAEVRKVSVDPGQPGDYAVVGGGGGGPEVMGSSVNASHGGTGGGWENPAEVYHTVHGGRKNTILASRRPEPFSKIVRRHPSMSDIAMPSLAEQLSGASTSTNSSPVRETENRAASIHRMWDKYDILPSGG